MTISGPTAKADPMPASQGDAPLDDAALEAVAGAYTVDGSGHWIPERASDLVDMIPYAGIGLLPSVIPGISHGTDPLAGHKVREVVGGPDETTPAAAGTPSLFSHWKSRGSGRRVLPMCLIGQGPKMASAPPPGRRPWHCERRVARPAPAASRHAAARPHPVGLHLGRPGR